MELVSTFFGILKDGAVITIVVNCSEEEWNKLVGSPIRFFYNRLFKVVGLRYDEFSGFSPGIVIDNENALNTMIRFLTMVISKKEYTIQYIKISPPTVSMFATIPVEDTSIFQEILNDLKTAKGGKT